MKFYIASTLENAEAATAMADRLKEAGLTQSYDWTTHGSVSGDPARIRQAAEDEAEGVKAADIVIVMMPGARGTHTELGIAIAYDKRIILCAAADEELMLSDRVCAFYYHPNVRRIIGNPPEWEAVILQEIVYEKKWQEKYKNGPYNCHICKARREESHKKNSDMADRLPTGWPPEIIEASKYGRNK